MKKHSILVGFVIGIIGLMCNKPLTGKKTLNFVSNSELFPLFAEYGTFYENKVITGTDARRVEAVGTKIKLQPENTLIL
jgi:hypothetical protein